MIITCPKCAKTHKVNPDTLKSFADAGKTSITASCKSCKSKFSVSIPELLAQEKKPVDAPGQEKKAVDTSGQEKKPIIDTQRRSRAATRKICISLSKGGVGKTTTSVSLGAGLALAGYKVLLVDTDTQGQSAYVLGKNPDAGLAELLTQELPASECLIEGRENLWLLGGGKALAGAKRYIDKKSFGAEFTFTETLAPLDDQFDFVLVDTSPGWDQLIVNVLFYATEVLVPVALEALPFQGMAEFIKSLGAIQKYRSDVKLKYIVPTFLDLRVKGPKKVYDQLKQLYPEQLCKPIRYNENLSQAPSLGKTIFEFAPGSTAAEDYRSLVRKVSGNELALIR